MNQKLREEIVVALEKAYIKAGATDFDQGMEQVAKFVAWFQNGFAGIRTRDELRTTLDGLEMSRGEEKMLLLAAKLLPQFLRLGLKKLGSDAQATLPQMPGGRPRTAKFAQAQALLNFISDLHRNQCTFGVAKRRAAARYGLSLRTVERLWAKRNLIDEGDPTVEDIIKLFES